MKKISVTSLILIGCVLALLVGCSTGESRKAKAEAIGDIIWKKDNGGTGNFGKYLVCSNNQIVVVSVDDIGRIIATRTAISCEVE